MGAVERSLCLRIGDYSLYTVYVLMGIALGFVFMFCGLSCTNTLINPWKAMSYLMFLSVSPVLFVVFVEGIVLRFRNLDRVAKSCALAAGVSLLGWFSAVNVIERGIVSKWFLYDSLIKLGW